MEGEVEPNTQTDVVALLFSPSCALSDEDNLTFFGTLKFSKEDLAEPAVILQAQFDKGITDVVKAGASLDSYVSPRATVFHHVLNEAV